MNDIRSSLKRAKVFLRREINEVMVNNYNFDILSLHQANMDIQFILDPYACVQYILQYINKSERGMSNLLRQVVKEYNEDNHSIKEKLKTIANTFINANEISAQEASYFLLGLSVSENSRMVTYVNTANPEERVQLIKSERELKKLDDSSTNIFQKK